MSDEQVREVLRVNKIGLTIDEARKIEHILGRAPTLTEAIIWGIQGSEHSSYKSSRQHLKQFPVEAPNVILGPVEDSGIVALAEVQITEKDESGKKIQKKDRYGIVVSHESHNHPSQIVPYEGAATGIGGCVRDVACMGARVLAVLDPLRFGNIDRNESTFVANGVIAGIGGYGNPIGVPNLGGDVYFHDSYNNNCLVNVVTLGLVRESEVIHSYVPEEAADIGYDFIIVGKPTDISGMGGAAFASLGLDEKDKESAKGAVQEPNPFLKRHLLVSTYALFKKLKKLNAINKVGFKDMGAGGNMCATVEMVAKRNLGAEIDLEKVHVAMKNMHPSVIACAETQERFCWVCHPDLTKMILDHYNKEWDLPTVAENARASVIGKVTKGNYVLKYKDDIVCDAPATAITEGLRYDRPYTAPHKELKEPTLPEPKDYNEILLNLLASENIASRKPVYEKYDKQVQGYVIVEAGEADAGVMAPLIDEPIQKKYKKIGFAVKADGSARYGEINPYYQGMNATVESMRNVTAVGAYPQCLTDCLNYGNPEKPDQMWELVEGIKGIADTAKQIKLKNYPENPTPVISGNVSLYNEAKGKAVAPSAIVCCIGKIDDVSRAVTMQIKKTGSYLYILGKRKNELGGSEYYRLFGELGANVPKPNLEEVQKEIYTVVDAITEKIALSAHDISEGGLAVTLAEMALGGRGEGKIGIKVNLENVLLESEESSSSTASFPPDMSFPRTRESSDSENWTAVRKLFSETGGFVVEIPPRRRKKFLEICAKYTLIPYEIGRTIAEPQFTVTQGRKKLINLPISSLADRWLNGLRERL